MDIDFEKIELVIFDVDGTLYDQSRLRRIMLKEILGYYLFKPLKINELKILKVFRDIRERISEEPAMNNDILHQQYDLVASKMGVEVVTVQSVVEDWIHNRPLKHLQKCTFINARDFIKSLKDHGIITAVYSDYRIGKKLEAMGIAVDHQFSAEQKEINAFKPDPRGLNYICEYLDVDKNSVLMLGDRSEKDGQSAKNAGIQFYILPKAQEEAAYHRLKKVLDGSYN